MDPRLNSMLRNAIQWEDNIAKQERNSKQKIEITGKVVDARTGAPIQDALCVVAGQGGAYSMAGSYAEFVSDTHGNITIFGTFPMITQPPYLIVYKKGYVGWDSKSIFPHGEFRQDFQWQNGYTFKLEKWDGRYSHKQHYNFIMGKLRLPANYKCKLKEAVSWEMTTEDPDNRSFIPETNGRLWPY